MHSQRVSPTDEVELHVAAIHPALHALATTHTHAHLEPFQTIQASDTIVIDPPALTPEQHSDAQYPKRCRASAGSRIHRRKAGWPFASPRRYRVAGLS
jgi:hypothetical protein